MADDLKPGYQTTEFWLSAIAALAGLIVGSGAFDETSVVIKVCGFALTTLAALGYTVSRGMAKRKY